jgi:hypothetical protein
VADYKGRGPQQIFYKSSGFKSTEVMADVRLPDITWERNLKLEPVEQGIFSLTYNFTQFGNYLLVYRENGLRSTIQHVIVDRPTNGGCPQGNHLINL